MVLAHPIFPFSPTPPLRVHATPEVSSVTCLFIPPTPSPNEQPLARETWPPIIGGEETAATLD